METLYLDGWDRSIKAFIAEKYLRLVSGSGQQVKTALVKAQIIQSLCSGVVVRSPFRIDGLGDESAAGTE